MSFNIHADYDKKITKKDLTKVFWRSIPMEHSWNYERMMHINYCYALIPVLRKLYPDKEKLSEAMVRHMEFYNTTPYIVTLPLGISAAMEERNAEEEDFDTQSISNVKTALMGPLAGVGDAFYWGTLRIIATGVGTSLALQGSILGPILFLLIYNVPAMVIRYILTFIGYKFGTDVLTKVEESGIMSLMTKAAAVMGLMVAGAMTAEMVAVNIPISFGVGDDLTTVQEILDGVIPGIMPLALFGIVYYMLKKKMKPIPIMVILLLIGIAGAFFGFLG